MTVLFFPLSLSLPSARFSLFLGSKAYSPPSSPISLNPHSGFARYEINSHSELPLMSPKVSLTIGDARGARSSIYIYTCVCGCIKYTVRAFIHSCLIRLQSVNKCSRLCSTTLQRRDARSDSDEMFA